jgi:NADPH:quinone reductase-like Zn-dependent oxidoreductase
MMRAWTFTARGTPSAVLKLRADLPRPTPSQLHADEVIVKVSHVAIEQGLALLMELAPHINSKPWIPGQDFSGIVDSVGSNVTHLRPGDPVFGSGDPKSWAKWGSKYNGLLVEYAILPAAHVVLKPPNISFAAAATLTCNGCTAVQFTELVNMKKGDRVLITGASGGLGTVMLQVARAVVGNEGTIVGTCSAANEEFVKKLGADEVSKSQWASSSSCDYWLILVR